MMDRKGPQTSGKAHPNTTPSQVPASLADVALIDARTAAAVGSMSVSWWHAEVAAGRAPAPILRRPRCTRWRMAEVAAFWRTFGEQGEAAAADAVTARATKASAAARAKRRTTKAMSDTLAHAGA